MWTVVRFWKVDDRAMGLLMVRMCNEMLEIDRKLSKALREAESD